MCFDYRSSVHVSDVEINFKKSQCWRNNHENKTQQTSQEQKQCTVNDGEDCKTIYLRIYKLKN